jgi:hypothetical protein
VVDETEPEVESDLRRRAAWLLGMLAMVAVLFVVVMTAVIGNDSSTSDGGQSKPLDGVATTGAASSSSPPASRASSRTSSAASTAPRTSATAHGPATCPTAQRCALDDDIGNAVAAVNAYRIQHGQAAVPGAVSAAAKQCALNNGNGCTGSWAESQVPGPDGKKAVDKVAQLAKLLSPMKSFGVGWAYDPAGKQYFFAIVRSD